MLLILAGALCLTAAGAAGVVRYVMFGHEEERSRKPAVLADPECRRAVRELLADVEVNLRRLRRTQPGPQRSVRVRALRASLSGEHFLSGSPVLKEVETAVRARTAALLEEDARAAADPSPNLEEERLVAALLEGERRLARADGL